MFNLSGLGIKIAFALGLIAIVIGGVLYIKKLKADLKFAQLEKVRLEESIRAKDAAMDQIKRDVENMNRIQTDLNTKLRAAERTATELSKRFNVDKSGKERSLNRLAGEKPVAIEGSINRGTRDALRCNEIITGSPLTPAEQSGKVSNTICPELFPSTEVTK